MSQPTRVQDVDLRLQLFALRKSPSSALEKRVERVEALEAAPQNFFIWQALLRPTFEHSIDTDRLDALKSRIVEVGVVNHLANLRERLVGNRKAFCERFERAVIAMVREFGVEHIERNCIWVGVSSWRKDEFRFAVNELRDQPR